MQANKKLTSIVVATLSSLCSTTYALEESLALMFAVTAARSLIATPPSIEVTSTESVLLRGASVLPLSDTQCMFTETPEETPEEQVCFGNNLPTRIRLLPAAPLNIGLLPNAISQIEYRPLPVFVTDPVFPGINALPEPGPALVIATEIQQSAERQREIIETARQRQQTFSSHSSPHSSPHSYDKDKSYFKSYNKGYDKRFDELGEKGIETDSKDFEWWWLWEPDPDTDDSDMATVHDDDSILLEPGSRYCFFSNVNDEPQARSQPVIDGESESEEDTSSGEDSESEHEDGADSDSSVKITHTSTDLLPVSKEVNDYYSAFMLKKIKVEPVNDNNTPVLEEIAVEIAGSTVCQPFNPPPAKKKKQAGSGSKNYRCPHPNCGESYTTYKSLSFHKRNYHTGKQICNVTVVGEDGQQRPCGKVCNSYSALSNHKIKDHTGQQTCDMPVIGEDGQERPCGKLCDNARVLLDHKRRYHTSKKTCDEPVIGEDGQERPCGKLCDNARALSDHKRRYHTGEQICNMTVVGEDGLERTCGKLCDNAKAFTDHKRRHHSEQKICDVAVIGEDGQEQLCGKICRNTRTLSYHKRRYHTREQTRRYHTREQTCDVTVVGEDGQKQPCGKAYNNAKALANHKRIHRKRKHDDVDPD